MGTAALVAVLVLAMAGMAAAAGTVNVRGDTAAGENLPGWMFNRDAGTATPFAFDDEQASIGDGSLHVLPIGINPADKMIAEFFPGTPDVATTTFSYDFWIGAGGTAADANEFYLNVYANFGSSDPNKFYDCRYNVVPTTGSTSAFTTVSFDPTVSYPVATRSGASASPSTCPAIPADMNTINGPAVIRAFAINVGDTSTSDVGLDGYLDKVVVTIAGDATTYDFEPSETKDDKQAVRDDLAALGSTGDEKDDKKLEKALEHLDKSLDPAYWIDGDTLVAKDGKKVFDEESKTVKELGKIENTDVSGAIASLVAIDEELAQNAIDDAWAAYDAADCTVTMTKECDKAAKELDKAAEEMAKAAEELADGDYDKAINKYKKAWEKAHKALKALS